MKNEEETMSMTNEALMLARLTETTKDPIDALRLAADLYAMRAYRATRALAISAGRRPPAEPKATSRYVRKLRAVLKAKFHAIAEGFDDDDAARLKRIGPAVSAAMDRNDPELSEQILKLMFMDPASSVEWIREHLDEIEARFAS